MLSVVAVAGLAVVGVAGMPAVAQAAPNPAIVVSTVTLSPGDTPATIGDTLLAAGEWDATAANPQAGDVFTIGLPPQFAFIANIPFPLLGADPNGNPVVWGNCLMDAATSIATCELTDAVTAFPEQVRGTWEFEIQTVQATTEEAVAFDLNGVPTLVDLPGEGGIDDGIELPGEVSKTGVMNQNNWSMTWQFDIPGANMVGQSTVTVTDVMGAGHALCEPVGFRVETVRGSTVVDVTSIAAFDGAAGDGGFTAVLTAPAGGFDPNVTYRLTYQTCTPDGQIDPHGTTYDNTASVEGWGDAGVGVGTVTNRPWQQTLTKSGSVLGGAVRNGEIAWTVTVPGDQLVGRDGILLTETLTGGHELCTGTIDGIRITERYGPSNQLQQDVTSRLSATQLAAGAQQFEVQFSITDPAFAFRASDYRYVITYRTCVTGDDLPAGGTAYGNEASVNGQVTTSEATVPARAQGKGGRINGSTVTLDGVQHMPQTTLGWTITIPGERIEGIDDVLTLTDTLSAAQAICEPGPDSAGLASQLGLRVEARDQIQNGGLSTVDLTGVTQVAADDNELTFDIAATDLPIPTGTSDGFTREYQYVVTYTTCTASGGMDAPGTVYGNDVVGSGIDFSTSVTQSNRGGGTGQGVARGSIAIDKTLLDTPGAALVPADAVFTVHVREIDPTGTTQVEYDLQVPLGGDPVSGFNARGSGWTVELTEPTFPTIAGVAFGTPTFASGPGVSVSEDGATAIASLTAASNVSVTLANEALLGAVSITKDVVGGAASLVDPDRTYRVTAVIDTSALGPNVPAQPDRVVDVVDGTPVVIDELPIGATVSFTEVVPADDDVLTWATPTISPASLVVTAAHAAEPATVTVTNSVERTVGTFSVSKIVTGAQADNAAVPEAVTVTATWTQDGTPGSTTLTLPTDGTAVPLGVDLLIGTEVTLTETPLVDGSSIDWGAPTWSGSGVAVDGDSAVVTVGRDPDASVVVENHAATSTAGISILKGIAGEAAGAVDPSTQFPVTATWTDAEGVQQTRDLMIDALEPTPLGVDLPAGTVVTITEGAGPDVAGVVWGSVTIGGDDVTDAGDGSATVVVSDQQGDATLVTVVNEATWAPGTFSIAKDVVGVLLDDPDLPDAVTVVATWVDGDGAQSQELTVPIDGTVVEFPREIAYGTEVTLTETMPDASPRFTWAEPTWSGDGESVEDGSGFVVTIGADTVSEVTLTNTAVASVGALTVTKTLTGSGAAASASTSFPVTVTWTDLLGTEQTRELQVVAGEPLVVADLPLGTPLTIQEHETTLADGVTWTAADWSSDSDGVVVETQRGEATAVVVLDGTTDAPAAVTVQNELALEAALPVTGADGASVWLLGLGAALALIAGVGIMRWRRPRA